MYVDSIKAKLKHPASKVRAWSFKKRVVFFVLALGVLLGIVFFLKPGFLLRQSGKIFPNSQIWAVNNSKALYENENPKFKVLLGDPQNPGKPKITYQLKTNPPREITFSLEKIIDSQNNVIVPDFILHPNLETVVGKKPKLIYREIIPGVDLSYQIKKGKGVKEEIVIREVKDKQLGIENIPITFIFEAQASSDIKPNRNLENIWYFTDEQDNYLWHFEKPFAEDGEDVRGDAELGIKDQILAEEGLEIKNYELSISIDTEWLFSPNRTYPIIIDPSIIHDADSDFSGTRNRVYDADTDSTTEFKTEYHELPADEHTVGLWHFNEGGDEIHFQEGESPTSSVGMDAILSDPEASNGKYASFHHGGTNTCQDYEDFTFDVTENVSVSIIVRGKERSDSVNSGSYAEVNVFLDPTNGGATGTSLGILRYPSYSSFGWNKWYTKNLQASLSSGTRTIRLCYWTEHRAGASDVNLGIDYIKVITTHTPDSSGNGNDGTIHGAPQINGKLGNALEFDGIDDYVDLGSWFNYNTFSISLWLNPGASQLQYADIMDNNHTGTRSWVVQQDSTTTNYYGFGLMTTPASEGSAMFTLTANVWQHLVVVKDTNQHRVYINGQLIDSKQSGATVTYDGTQYLRLARWGGGGRNWNGLIDEVRISNRALTPEEIKANAQRRPYGIYTSQVIDLGSDVASLDSLSWSESGVQTGDGEMLYDDTNLVAQWNFNENSGTTAFDETTNCGGTGCDGTLTNFADTTGQDVAAGSGWTTANARWPASAPEALMFDGSNDYVTVTDHNDLDITSAITLEAWVKPTATGKWQGIIRKERYQNDTSGSERYGLDITTNDTFRFILRDSSDAVITALTYAPSTLTEWHYVAGTYSGSEAVLYVDGEPVVSESATGTIGTNNTVLVIGYQEAAASYFSGTIDSPRIYSRALGVDEILSNYQAGNVEFQTRTGADNTPDDGSWEAWKPTTSETAIASMDADQANWSWDNTATYMPKSKADDSTTKVEGTGSMKVTTGTSQVDANTVALWHLDETNGDLAGNDVFDETTNNNDGEFNGTNIASAVVDGISGKARSFNGSDDYVDCGSDSSLKPSNFTIETWIKPSDVTSDQVVAGPVGNEPSGNCGYGYHLLVSSNGKAGFRVDPTGCGNGLTIYSKNIIAAGNWYHLAGTYEGTTLKFYLNGEFQSSGSQSIGYYTKFFIGAAYSEYSSAYYKFFDGTIDEVRISNVARTAEEIAEAYRAGRDHRLSRTISSTDLSSKTKLPFYIAADRPGTYLEATVGESTYANYEPDSNTKGLWHLEEGDQGNSSIIKFTSTNIAAANAYTYWKTLDDATTLATNDTFEYDVYILNNLGGLGGIDIRFTNGTYARDVAGWTDQNSLSCHPGNNISSYTYGKWYHRKCTVPSGLNGKVIDWIDLVNEINTSTSITAYYDNFIIKNSSGSIKTTIYTQGAPDYNVVDLRSNASNIGNAVQSTYQAESISPADRQGGVFIKDASGNSNNGTPYGTGLTQGKIGKARSFDSSSIALGTLNISAQGSPFSVFMWINTTQTGVANDDSIMFSKRDGSNTFCFDLEGSNVRVSNWAGSYPTNSITGSKVVNDGKWHNVGFTWDGTTVLIYVDGGLDASKALSFSTQSIANGNSLGAFDSGTTRPYVGSIDEVVVSNAARSADEIRQAYEIGRRTHPITIDFIAKLDSGNLITDANDTSFTVDVTAYGFEDKGDNLYKGDKIIVKENYGGTKYITQGTVDSVSASTGAVTVSSWDSGSSFPMSGYTQHATVFKWQREWFDITAPLDSHLNTTTRITLRITDGSEGRTFWLDDFRSGGPYLTNSSGSAITSTTQKYFQYRVIFSTTDTAVSPSLISVTLDYKLGGFPPIISPSGGGFLSF